MADPASTVWRDYVTDGVPGSGAHQPDKADVREWGTSLEFRIKTISATSYTLLTDDDGWIIDFTAATAVTVTVPAGLGDKFACGISQGGLGKVTLSASGVSLIEPDSLLATEKRYVLLFVCAFAANALRIFGRTS